MTATHDLIRLAHQLHPSGVIGDGMVAEFHARAKRAAVEQGLPECFASNPDPQAMAENDCDGCRCAHACLDI